MKSHHRSHCQNLTSKHSEPPLLKSNSATPYVPLPSKVSSTFQNQHQNIKRHPYWNQTWSLHMCLSLPKSYPHFKISIKTLRGTLIGIKLGHSICASPFQSLIHIHFMQFGSATFKSKNMPCAPNNSFRVFLKWTFINDSFKALLYIFKNTFKIIIFYILKRKKTSNMYQTSTKFKLLSLLIGYLELQMNALAFVFSFHNSCDHFPPIPLSSLEHTLML